MKFVQRLVLLMSLLLMGAVPFSHAQEGEQYFPPADLTNPAAPFIFTHDYAISKGASAEWRKMEGVVYDVAHQKIYVAITRISSAMADELGGIQLAENPCGMVLVGDLDENWNVSELRPLIIGGPFDEAAKINDCNLDNIAEPDNLFVDGNGDVWIAEDTDHHANGVLWKYEIATSTLIRFATAPLGAEFTGLRILDDGTIFLNLQHPDETNPEPFNVGTVGYIADHVATDSANSLMVPEGDAQLTLQVAAGEYVVLGRGGEAIAGSSGNIWGDTYVSVNGTPFSDDRYCTRPDGNVFIPTGEGTALLYTNWECNPGGVSKATLQWTDAGRWAVVGGEQVDFAEARGTVNNCNASLTPWGTILTSEEYAPRLITEWSANGNTPVMDGYMEAVANPYDYGYNVEIIPNADGSHSVVRHYAMGRRINEQASVAPDQRTVYFGDDGTDRIFYKFVADVEGDLSAGTLYAAQVTQTGTDKVSDFAFTLEWIELGHGNNAEIEAAVRALDYQE